MAISKEHIIDCLTPKPTESTLKILMTDELKSNLKDAVILEDNELQYIYAEGEKENEG
ncbi:hypothetical protein [Macrococcoides caseolyticum]|uniref:hypothetical protein n=1 Tax=Macrococcoides caseolyticum TaxID=69966 RepID=UPI0012FF1545|nr:hypothetical protein [Macrococcus caseolyticus]